MKIELMGEKTNSKMKDLNLTISIIIINVNGPKSLIKRQRFSDWIKRQDPTLPIRNKL